MAGGYADSNMNARNFSLALLALTLAGCKNQTVLNDASKWTIELESSGSPPSGACRIYDDLHRLMLEGTLTSGKMDGTWISTGSDGTQLAVWSYRRGVRHGPVRMWYSALDDPEASGHFKLEGTFADGQYDGTVTRSYPSGANQSVRVYERKALKSAQYWSPNGVEKPAADAMAEAASELKADLTYLATLEDMVRRALAQAQRKVRSNR